MQLSIRDLTFAYPGGEPVFEHLNLNLDTGWRLGTDRPQRARQNHAAAPDDGRHAL